MSGSQASADPMNKTKRPGLSGLTRYVVVPLLLLAIGVRIGMYVERARRPQSQAPGEPARQEPAPAAPAQREAAAGEQAAPPTCEV